MQLLHVMLPSIGACAMEQKRHGTRNRSMEEKMSRKKHCAMQFVNNFGVV